MIKTVLFDFDGVLTIDKTGSTSITNYIANNCGISLELVKSSYSKFNEKLLLGEKTHQEIWEDFCNLTGQNIDFNILLDSFRFTPLDDKMISLVQELKKKYYIGIVTDNKYDRISTILDYRGLNKYFDVVAVSACLHSGKDNRRIFDYVLKSLNVSANECVFIDNSEKNLEIPRQMGMSTILFNDENRNFELFEKELEKILCKVN